MTATMPRRTTALLTTVLVGGLVMLTGSCVPGVGADKITVTAYFTDSAGLFAGNDVGVLGVPVGTITEIEPAGDKVAVTMEIDADQPVPADAGAVVVARSVATDRYVELTPVYAGGPKLEDGDDISVDSTRTPVDFDEVLATIDEFATGISGSKETTDAIRRFVDTSDAAFSGQGKLLNRTITSLSEATADVSGQRGDLIGTLDSLDELVAAIAENERTVRAFLRKVAQGTSLLNDQRQEFKATLRALDRAVRTVADFAVKNREEIVATLNGSADVMETVMDRQKQLAEILEVMPLALQNLQAATNGDRVPMRIDPLVIAPLGDQLSQLCDQLPGDLSELVCGLDPQLPRTTGATLLKEWRW